MNLINQEIQALLSNVQHSKYIDLEKLMKLYVEYTLYFNDERKAQYKITDLEQKMADMSLKQEMQ